MQQVSHTLSYPFLQTTQIDHEDDNVFAQTKVHARSPLKHENVLNQDWSDSKISPLFFLIFPTV